MGNCRSCTFRPAEAKNVGTNPLGRTRVPPTSSCLWVSSGGPPAKTIGTNPMGYCGCQRSVADAPKPLAPPPSLLRRSPGGTKAGSGFGVLAKADGDGALSAVSCLQPAAHPARPRRPEQKVAEQTQRHAGLPRSPVSAPPPHPRCQRHPDTRSLSSNLSPLTFTLCPPRLILRAGAHLSRRIA